MIARIRSYVFWRKFQRHYRNKERAAQAKHGNVNEVRKERTAILHKALEGVK